MKFKVWDIYVLFVSITCVKNSRSENLELKKCIICGEMFDLLTNEIRDLREVQVFEEITNGDFCCDVCSETETIDNDTCPIHHIYCPDGFCPDCVDEGCNDDE